MRKRAIWGIVILMAVIILFIVALWVDNEGLSWKIIGEESIKEINSSETPFNDINNTNETGLNNVFISGWTASTLS